MRFRFSESEHKSEYKDIERGGRIAYVTQDNTLCITSQSIRRHNIPEFVEWLIDAYKLEEIGSNDDKQ